MITPTSEPTPTSTSATVRIVQAAELTDNVGSKAIITIGGVLFTSLMPETPTEAQAINATIQNIGGK